MYIYIYAVKSLSGFEGLSSGPSRGYYLVQGDIGQIIIVVSSDILHTQLSFHGLGDQLSSKFLEIYFIFCFKKLGGYYLKNALFQV